MSAVIWDKKVLGNPFPGTDGHGGRFPKGRKRHTVQKELGVEAIGGDESRSTILSLPRGELTVWSGPWPPAQGRLGELC